MSSALQTSSDSAHYYGAVLMLSVATDKFRVGVPKDEPKDKELELFQAVTGGCPLQSIKPLIKARCEQLDAWMMMQADEQDWPMSSLFLSSLSLSVKNEGQATPPPVCFKKDCDVAFESCGPEIIESRTSLKPR